MDYNDEFSVLSSFFCFVCGVITRSWEIVSKSKGGSEAVANTTKHMLFG